MLIMVPISAELFEELARDGAIVVRVDPAPDHYWRFSAPSLSREVVLSHAEYHLRPAAREACGGVVVGANELLLFLRSDEVVWSLPLPCRFFAILEAGTDTLLVQHEIGFMKVSCGGKVISEVITGLLSSFSLNDGVLTYRTFEGETKSVDL